MTIYVVFNKRTRKQNEWSYNLRTLTYKLLYVKKNTFLNLIGLMLWKHLIWLSLSVAIFCSDLNIQTNLGTRDGMHLLQNACLL